MYGQSKIAGWNEVYNAIRRSEELLEATLDMNGQLVAKMIQEVHMQNTSSLIYNNEVSLASIVQLAYYTAVRSYTLIREMPAGNGFADMVFLPKRASDKPALIVELKWDKAAESAIRQIKEKRYPSALSDYKGAVLLVGINYDKKSRDHACRIERIEI